MIYKEGESGIRTKTSYNRGAGVRTNHPLTSPAMCAPDQDAAKHFRTKKEASSKHRMWGVEKH